MTRMKSVLAVLCLAAIVGVVPMAQAQNLETVIAGSSGLWQAMGVGAYNGGTSIVAGGGATFHWTSASNSVNLTDTRVTPVNNDAGTMWVVWDSATPPNVWVYDKVDSVVGMRCYFAAPKCNINATSATLAAAGASQISSALWGADTNLPASIQALFASGQFVSVGATDIRPEDAAFVACRVNSALGASTAGGASSDHTDGLGYNTHNAAGVCPVFSAATAQTKGLGNPILSGYPASTSQANVLAFNLTGKDPISGTLLPAQHTTTPVGVAPIVFMIERDKGQLANLTNASEVQLQEAFSGTNCDASAFGLPAGNINIFLREPLSGTMNTTEASVFRRPTVYPNPVLGLSQELHVGNNNPLKGQAGTCVAGAGHRYRVVGSGEAAKGVQHSGDGTFPDSVDGIAYTFFSYGNVSSLADNTKYGYIQLNGVDPIFASYGTRIDPGQPAVAGELPGAADLPASCGAAFPCSEHAIWSNGFSLPNVRNGTYRAWSLLRLVATGTAQTNAQALINAAQKGVVNLVPDYVPAKIVPGTTDLGIKLLRSHYQQKSGSGAVIGNAPVNQPNEQGGDMGGAIIPTLTGVTTENQIKLIQNQHSGGSGPVLRP
ncbi:MAG TPA: hypothetical protein VFE61_13950 [Candidatus Sulfotelmatobacter sp.]|nr:hypothetical protein [Candidatus Sulfotelmatobacter sp.]